MASYLVPSILAVFTVLTSGSFSFPDVAHLRADTTLYTFHPHGRGSCLSKGPEPGTLLIFPCTPQAGLKFIVNDDKTLQVNNSSPALCLEEGSNNAVSLATCDGKKESQHWTRDCGVSNFICFIRTASDKCLKVDEENYSDVKVGSCTRDDFWSIRSSDGFLAGISAVIPQ
ncbi:uncharacterized protein LOC110849805 [Folsomia candida]|uniref:uncharacterized protein LOC110849805 n=1 Tax=Folsomia candida TaxID=158441 RepID=UPI000B8FF708|nr:uncharacterized protein LOC110849805 [Folsomia candida]